MNKTRTYLVTGGAGFIGSSFVLIQRKKKLARIINLDMLTYAGNPKNLEALSDDPKVEFHWIRVMFSAFCWS